MNPSVTTLAVVIGNREFFPDQLVAEARQDVIDVFGDLGIRPVLISPDEGKLGGIETHAEARRCAELFERHRGEIEGILVVLPNFGDEKGVTDAIRLSGLNVPVLIQGYPDDLNQLGVSRRRDAFCGKISVCNNLVQANIKFTLTTKHVAHPHSPSFRGDLERFCRVCRVVKGLRSVRLGAVGARPGAFNTVRYSEKILERHGISVTTVDLSEFLAQVDGLSADDAAVRAKLDRITQYAPAPDVPAERLLQMAKLGVVLTQWIELHALDATAIQCWTSVQQNLGCNVCTLMSMMSEQFMPSACEVDVTGVLTMYAMQLAAGSPAAIVDWNNNYGDDENKCVLFHIPGIEMNTGALGHGLSICVGIALAAKMDRAAYRVFTLLGDGELAEGSNWEAAMAAAHYQLDNLTAILDHNTLQLTGPTRDVCNSEPVDQKFRAFGWDTEVCDGHDVQQLTGALSPTRHEGRPTLVIANTVKGRGVSFMENVVKWHHGVPNEAEYQQAMAELDKAEATLMETFR